MASIHRIESNTNYNHQTNNRAARIARLAIIFAAIAALFIGVLRFGNLLPRTFAATTVQNSVSVTSVSAASFVGSPAALGQNSIAAAFGTQLATGLQIASGQPLPTTLGGTTVTVGGIAAQLFFVSPGQINYLIPSNVPPGDAQVVVISTAGNGDQVISRGQIKIAGNGPSIFTANSNGTGVPAAVTGRVTPGGQFVFDPNPPFEPDPVTPGRLIPSPIDVGTTELPAFLILYATGLRNVASGSVQAIIGGITVPVTPVPAPGFTGLDQVNLQIPVSLKGSGLVDVTLVAAGVSSNSVTVNLAGTPNNALAVTGFSVTDPAIAGQTVSISGNGFSTNPADNIVRFGEAQARVISATTTQLSVIVPFGAESGRVLVQNQQGETRSAASFKIKTSLSGIVQSTGTETTGPVPLENVAIRIAGTNTTVRSNRQGAFVIADIPEGAVQIEIDGGTTNSSPPYPRILLKKAILADRDNQFSQPVSLQQVSGGSGSVGSFAGDRVSLIGDSLSVASDRLRAALARKHPESKDAALPITDNRRPATRQQSGNKNTVISDRGVSLEVPVGTSVRFPDGKTSGSVQVTLVQRSRLPGLALPIGVYSPAIAQITPLGTQFSPGANLSFPNPDQANLPAGAKVDLYRYDFSSGAFIKRGTATVSADRARVVSDSRVVDVASFWFAAAPGGVTTVVGRVINELGFPVSGAQVTVNGRADRTDSNGGFAIVDVATAGNAQIQAEAVLPRQWASSPRGTSSLTTVVPGGVTNVGSIALSNTNVTGLVLAPFVIDFNSADPPQKVEVTLTQPALTGGLVVSLTSSDATVATVPATVTIPAGQTTVSFNVTRTGPGFSILNAKATVSGNALETFAVVTVSQPAPTLAAVLPTAAPPGAKIIVAGVGFSSVPDNNILGLFRGGNLIWIFDPEENQVLIDATGRVGVRVEVPPVAAGAATIRAAVINDFTGVLSDISEPLNFTVSESNVPTPVLSSVSPMQGKPRDIITLNGSNFSTTLSENRVTFLQPDGESEARVVTATATQLTVAVPSQGIKRGAALIVAGRITSDGARSNRSNALEFNITDEAGAPAKPALNSVVNAVSGQASGRDGNTIRAQGTGFGQNFYDPLLDDVGNSEPLISLFLFYQNNQFVDFALPISATGGTQLTTIVPTGLAAGTAQITVATFDLETGSFSDESNPVDFAITAGSLRHVDEDEPNDTLETATEVPFPSVVDGDVDVNDPAGIVIRFNDGTFEPLNDLFVLTLDKSTALTMTLNFTLGGDLDLFVLQQGVDGGFSVLASSTQANTIIEQLAGTLPAGKYIIAVGAYAGFSPYSLTLSQGAAAFHGTFAPQSVGVRQPMLVERKRD